MSRVQIRDSLRRLLQSLLLVLGVLALAAACRAQDITITNAGWFGTDGLDGLAVTNDVTGEEDDLQQDGSNGRSPLTPPAIAEAITADIRALARGLENDPVRIFNYVHDHIRYEVYFGSKKGAQLTLLEKSGNDFDQCALLMALLRAAGYNNANYQFGWML